MGHPRWTNPKKLSIVADVTQKRSRAQAVRASARTAGELHAMEFVLEKYKHATGLREGTALWEAITERSGVSVGTLKGFFYGDRWPQEETLAKLAAGLGFSEKWIQDDLVKPIDEPTLHPWSTSEVYRRRVATAIADAMLDQGIDYKDSDRLGGVDRYNVRAIINADPLVSFDRVQRLCAALGVDIGSISAAPPIAPNPMGA